MKGQENVSSALAILNRKTEPVSCRDFSGDNNRESKLKNSGFYPEHKIYKIHFFWHRETPHFYTNAMSQCECKAPMAT